MPIGCQGGDAYEGIKKELIKIIPNEGYRD